MNIAVINYIENGCEKSKETVVEDIINYWTTACEQTKLEMGSQLREQLGELSKTKICNIEFEDTATNESRKYIVDSLKKKQIDLLVTYNFAGFEISTLTDGLAYNLVDCRQFHFVEDDKCYNNEFLKKQKSINMFIVDL